MKNEQKKTYLGQTTLVVVIWAHGCHTMTVVVEMISTFLLSSTLAGGKNALSSAATNNCHIASNTSLHPPTTHLTNSCPYPTGLTMNYHHRHNNDDCCRGQQPPHWGCWWVFLFFSLNLNLLTTSHRVTTSLQPIGHPSTPHHVITTTTNIGPITSINNLHNDLQHQPPTPHHWTSPNCHHRTSPNLPPPATPACYQHDDLAPPPTYEICEVSPNDDD